MSAIDPTLFWVLILMTERLITFSLSDDNDLVFNVLADTGYFIGVRRHFGLFFIICCVLSLSSQIIYYYNYRNGVKPTFLRLFQVMSGLIPPKAVNLTNNEDIRRLVSTTGKLYPFLIFHNNFIVHFLAIVFVPTVFLFTGHPFETLVYGLPNAFLFLAWAHYFWNNVLFQFLVFHIICLYLKIKINRLNESLSEMKRRKRFVRIKETLQSFNSLYSEINEYNKTFWSKFLGVFWLTYGLNIVMYLYITLFIPMAFFILIILIYVMIVIIISFLFIIITASSVTYSANKSYKTMNSLYVSYFKYNKHPFHQRFSTKMNVRSIYSFRMAMDVKGGWGQPLASFLESKHCHPANLRSFTL